MGLSPTPGASMRSTRRDVALASIIGLELKSAVDGSDICLFLPGADNHESGTCRMGVVRP